MINLELVKSCKSVIGQFTGTGHYHFFTDSRKYEKPGVFVAIPGEKVNPLNLITNLLEAECPYVFFQNSESNQEIVKELKSKYSKTFFVPVKDSVTFLQEISHLHIREWKTKNPRNKVFGIAGSNGKTTHKEMLSFILRSVLTDKVISTEKNYNNHIGVPFTLLNVTDKTEIVVLELGSNSPGEIKVLCDIAEPDFGITTNIGATHLEFFPEGEKQVFEEESYVFTAVKNHTNGNGLFFINMDDQYLKTLMPTKGSVTYGESKDAMAQIRFTDTGAVAILNNESFVASNSHITGRHNKFNLITCLMIASAIYPEHKESFTKACHDFRPTRNRSEWIEFEGRQVYLDAYNANPSSMKAALLGFKESVKEKGLSLDSACVVVGDMYELGVKTPEYHRDLAKFVQDQGFKNVYFVGKFANHYLEGYPTAQGRASAQDFKAEYRSECLKKHEIHFIKGSRSLQLESLFDIR